MVLDYFYRNILSRETRIIALTIYRVTVINKIAYIVYFVNQFEPSNSSNISIFLNFTILIFVPASKDILFSVSLI